MRRPSLVLAGAAGLLLAAAGCKADAPAPAPATGSGARPPSAAPGRSGTIDLPRGPARAPSAAPPAAPARALSDEDRAELEERGAIRRERMDADGNGTISPEELAAAQQHQAETVRARLDTDGDGKVTPDELATTRMARRFGGDDLDTNRDNDISIDELRAAMEAGRKRREDHRRALGGAGAPEAPAAP